MLRVYTKPKGQIPDYEEPVILHAENPTIEEFCGRLHKVMCYLVIILKTFLLHLKKA
jgi:ribosome-interacting GTPase 1